PHCLGRRPPRAGAWRPSRLSPNSRRRTEETRPHSLDHPTRTGDAREPPAILSQRQVRFSGALPQFAHSRLVGGPPERSRTRSHQPAEGRNGSRRDPFAEGVRPPFAAAHLWNPPWRIG